MPFLGEKVLGSGNVVHFRYTATGAGATMEISYEREPTDTDRTEFEVIAKLVMNECGMEEAVKP